LEKILAGGGFPPPLVLSLLNYSGKDGFSRGVS